MPTRTIVPHPGAARWSTTAGRFARVLSLRVLQDLHRFWRRHSAGGAQHLTRLMGRGRALEVMLSAQDYDADLAERYGWINRALPAGELGDFVRSLAHRIASFPAANRAVVKERVSAIALAPVEDIRRDSDLFLQGARTNEFQQLTQAAMKRGSRREKRK